MGEPPRRGQEVLGTEEDGSLKDVPGVYDM